MKKETHKRKDIGSLSSRDRVLTNIHEMLILQEAVICCYLEQNDGYFRILPNFKILNLFKISEELKFGH